MAEDLLLEEDLLFFDDSSIRISLHGVVGCWSFFSKAFFYWLGELAITLLALSLALDGLPVCCLCFGDLGLVVNLDYRFALFASCAAAFDATLIAAADNLGELAAADNLGLKILG